MYQWKNISVGTDDVVITGIRLVYQGENGEDVSVIEGKEGYILEVTNPLAAGREKELASLLGAMMIGATFRKFEGDHIAYPLAEFMDPSLIVDRKQNVYRTYITDIDFTFLGMTTLKNSAEDALRNSSQYFSDGVMAYIKARKLVVQERTEREKAVANLAKQLSESSGLFMTEEVQGDKSVIYYMHDKPTLKESQVIWKLTALAFGISTDGGKTYPYGFTVDGETITRLLYAEGINADYIKTGVLNIADPSGKSIFYADFATGKVEINASSVMIGSSSVEQAINGMEVGGTNLLLNTKDFGANWWGNNTNLGAVEDPFGGMDAYAFKGTADGNSYLIQSGVVKRSGKYVASLWAKASKPDEIYIGCQTFRVAKLSLTTDWQRFEVPFEATNTSAEWWCFGSYGTWNDTETEICLYHPKLEEGTIATDWSPSPNDMVAQGSVILAVNQSDESVTISAEKINIDGLVPKLNTKSLKASELESGSQRKLIINDQVGITVQENDIPIIAISSLSGNIGSIAFMNKYFANGAGMTYITGEAITTPSLVVGSGASVSGATFGCNLPADLWKDVVAYSNFTCKGTKSRLAKTENYNERLLYCYEMPTPYFGDIGEGQLDETGICYVYIDDIFIETIDTSCNYQVFIQKYGEGDLVVTERKQGYFVVKGTPGLSFAWELKAKQSGYTMERLEELTRTTDEENKVNYEAEANVYLTNYEKEILNYA